LVVGCFRHWSRGKCYDRRKIAVRLGDLGWNPNVDFLSQYLWPNLPYGRFEKCRVECVISHIKGHNRPKSSRLNRRLRTLERVQFSIARRVCRLRLSPLSFSSFSNSDLQFLV